MGVAVQNWVYEGAGAVGGGKGDVLAIVMQIALAANITPYIGLRTDFRGGGSACNWIPVPCGDTDI